MLYIFQHAEQEKPLYQIVLRGEGDGALREFTTILCERAEDVFRLRAEHSGGAPGVPFDVLARARTGELVGVLTGWLENDTGCSAEQVTGSQEVTVQDPCRTREVLGIVGDKWALLIVRMLEDGPLRFTELKRAVDGISQRMLTVTLRDLERDGILTRTVRNVMPPHVSYELTTMGRTLREATAPLLEWSIANLPHIDAARTAYDTREVPGP